MSNLYYSGELIDITAILVDAFEAIIEEVIVNLVHFEKGFPGLVLFKSTIRNTIKNVDAKQNFHESFTILQILQDYVN